LIKIKHAGVDVSGSCLASARTGWMVRGWLAGACGLPIHKQTKSRWFILELTVKISDYWQPKMKGSVSTEK